MNNCLILFAKNLVLGKVKSRLAKDIGDEQALKVYKKLSEHTHTIAKALECTKHIFYSDKLEENDLWTGNFQKYVQEGNDLGEKMKNAFHYSFSQGNEKVVIIGSDCYELTSEIIEEAFEKLNDSDFVMGPAKDGGYYLLGMNAPHLYVFEKMEYSHEEVAKQTLDKIRLNNHSIALLKELSDVDTVEDLDNYPQLSELVKAK